MSSTRFVVALLISLLLPQVAAATDTITIAAEDDWAPYSSLKADGSGPEGFAVDLVRQVFATKGVEVKFVATPFSRCLHDAELGVVAGCFNATITSGNKDLYYWHETPLFHEGLAIFGHVDDPSADLTVTDLEGKTVGVTTGYTYPTEFMNDRKIKKTEATSDAYLLRMLAAKRVDYILINTMPGLMRAGQDPQVDGKVKQVGIMQKDGFWLAFSKVDPKGKEMSELFQQALTDFIASGEYEKLESAFHARMGMGM